MPLVPLSDIKDRAIVVDPREFAGGPHNEDWLQPYLHPQAQARFERAMKTAETMQAFCESGRRTLSLPHG